MRPRGFIVATRFLTRVPMPGRAVEADELAPSAAWFPIVGALIGGATAAVAVFTTPWLALIFAALLTGCFHEDGLADACDGLGGGFTRARKLEIMRDSRIGSYGAIALVLLYLARFTLFTQLGRALLFVLPAAGALGRGAGVAMMAWLPAARAEGVAEETSRTLRPFTVIAAMATTAAIVAALRPALALPFIAAAIAITAAFGFYLRNRLGGVTGDTLGAVTVIVETAALAIAEVLAR